MTKLRYTSSITGEPYAEIGTDEPSEEEWDRFLEKKGMKRRDKSRFTKTDVKSICELSNELIRYRQGYAFMANMIVNISAGKEDPPILLDFLPDDEHARFVHRTIREWGEKIYKNKNEENNPDGETESTVTKEGNSRFGELRTMNQFKDKA